MARAQGGRRQGVQGRTYPNRTDLTMNARPLPVMTATDQSYGVAGEQAASQRAVPMAPSPAAGLTAPAGAAPAGPLPGSFGAFNRPTDRPNEPVTHGAARGPGAGMEALGLPAATGLPAAQMLQRMAQVSGSPTLAALALRAQQLGNG